MPGLPLFYEVITGKALESLDFKQVRGMKGVKVAEIDINGLNLKVAVAHGLSRAEVLLDQVKKGISPYHFIEIMACPGGCLGGGGQPIPTTPAIREARAKSLYIEDSNKTIRKSHENPAIMNTQLINNSRVGDRPLDEIKEGEITQFTGNKKDFIHDDEIQLLLKKSRNADTQEVRDIIQKSLSIKRLEPEETAALLNVKDNNLWEEIFSPPLKSRDESMITVLSHSRRSI